MCNQIIRSFKIVSNFGSVLRKQNDCDSVWTIVSPRELFDDDDVVVVVEEIPSPHRRSGATRPPPRTMRYTRTPSAPRGCRGGGGCDGWSNEGGALLPLSPQVSFVRPWPNPEKFRNFDPQQESARKTKLYGRKQRSLTPNAAGKETHARTRNPTPHHAHSQYVSLPPRVWVETSCRCRWRASCFSPRPTLPQDSLETKRSLVRFGPLDKKCTRGSLRPQGTPDKDRPKYTGFDAETRVDRH